MPDRPQQLRTEISESWHRSASTGVSIDLPAAPVTLDEGTLRHLRGTHPLGRVQPLVEDVLGDAVRDCGAVLALGDADGHLLWVSGTHRALRRAERIGFVAGSHWDERVAGTNAPGTALRLDSPLAVHGGEHYLDAVRGWNCAAIPIHDPATGAALGVLDVTGGEAVALPQTLAMVRAAARMAETELAHAFPDLTRPSYAGPPPLPHASADFTLEALGRTEAVLAPAADRRRAVRLGPRHSEMLVLLSAHPGGLTGTELAELVYPQRVSPATVRAEVNRLRALVGADVLESRPYRLRVQVSGDWSVVQALLGVGDVEGAVRCYRGRLLPRSTSPAVEALADDLEWSLRAAVLDSGRADLMAAWTRTEAGADDLEMWTAQAEHLPEGSALAPLVAARIARLDRELAGPAVGRRRG